MRNPSIFLPSLLKCAGYSLFLAALVAFISFNALRSQSRAERAEVAALADAFLEVYIQTRQDGAPVPAEFRRFAIEEYQRQNADRSQRLSMIMPGPEGHAIVTEPPSAEIAALIADFQASSSPTPQVGTVFRQGQVIDRTVFPSVATSEACVSCHNGFDTGRVWQVGDVMGAFVLQNDLTQPTITILWHSILIFVCGSFCFGILLGLDEMRSQRRVQQLEAEIEARRHREEEEIRFLARHDPLTEIGNRTLLGETVDALERSGEPYDLLLFDLDGFKQTNDDFGHAAGDAILKHTANAIRHIVEPLGGSVARLGGDEFAATLPTGPNQVPVQKVAEELIVAIGRPFQFAGKALTSKASIGVAHSRHADMDGFEDLNRAADAALYEAKGNNPGSYLIYDTALHERLKSRRRMEKALPAALAQGAFDIHFQPQVILETGALRGFEALLRWRHDGETVTPLQLIPILEDSGLICDVDLWVLEQVLVQLSDWDSQGLAPVHMAINLSPLHFRNKGLLGRVKEILAKSAIAPSRLTFEITESILLNNWDDVAETLASLRSLGIEIALDDFGTGYSSLAYLRNLEVDEIKLDRAFLVDIESSEETRFLFDGIADMTTGLGRRLVVEGVETAAQAALLSEHQGQIAQGFYFGRPAAAVDVQQLIPFADDWIDAAERTTK